MQKRMLLVAVALVGVGAGKAHAAGTWAVEGTLNKPVVTSITEDFTGATPPNESADVSIAAPSQTTTWVFNRAVHRECLKSRR